MISPRRLLPVPLLVLALAASGCGDETTAKDVEDGTTTAAQSAAVPEATPTVSATTSTEAADPKATDAAVKTLVDTVGSDLKKAPTIKSPSAQPPTSLLKEDVVTGKGTAAKVGDKVDVRYTLVNWGGDDTPVDSSWTRSPNNSEFPLEKNSLIEGWIKGIPGMKPGGRRVLVVPAADGYGDQGTPDGSVPPGGTLIFVIDLIKAG